jgi:hypothetical protein
VIKLEERESLLLPAEKDENYVFPTGNLNPTPEDKGRVMVGATICFRQFSLHFYFMLRFHLGFNLWSKEYCANDRKAIEEYESWPVFL